MPNHKSAEKRLRQSQRRRIRNRRVKTAVRTAIKKARASSTATDKTAMDKGAAQQDFVTAEKLLASAAAKGVINKKAAARRISRLARALKKGAAKAA